MAAGNRAAALIDRDSVHIDGMRQDPNHYYERVRELRERLVSGRFIDTDTRVLDFEGLSSTDSDFGVQLQCVWRLFAQLSEDVLDSMGEVERRAIAEIASAMRETLRSAQQHIISNGRNAMHREHITGFAEQFRRLSGILSAVFIGRFLDTEGQFTGRTQQITDVVDAAISDMREKSEELRSRIQTDLTQAAVSKNANFFRAEASRYAWLSFWWGLGCIVWFAVLISGAAVLALNASVTGRFIADVQALVPSMPPEYLLLQALASKAIVVGAFTYVGVVLVKAFMSVLNAHVTNRHRAVSLDTYKFLLDGAQSDADRQSIIQRAAEAVFTLQDTGLIKAVPGADGTPLNTTINLPKIA